MENKQFIEELNKYVEEQGSAAVKVITDNELDICSFELKVKVPKEFLESAGLNEDIAVVLIASPVGNRARFFYKDAEIQPISNYIRRECHRDVSTIEILSAAISQDTHTPNIKDLEYKEDFLVTDEDKAVFTDALLNPPKPNAALEKAQGSYEKHKKQKQRDMIEEESNKLEE